MAFLNLQQLEKAHGRFSQKHRAEVEQVAEEAGQFGVRYVLTNPTFKPRTGNLQKKTESKVIRRGKKAVVVSLRNRAPYAAAIDRGAKPHVIRARRRKALRFFKGGSVVFRRHVNHPGNRPFKFLYRATTAAGRVFEQEMAHRMVDLAKQF